MLCMLTTVASKNIVDLRYKVCITRKTNTEIEAVISMHDQQCRPNTSADTIDAVD